MAGTLSVTEAVDKFVNNIKKKYQGRRIIQEEQLLCCRSEKLVRLELVKKKRLQASEQRGNEYGSEDSSITRTPLAYADLFKVEEGKKEIKMILIDGDAGIGKTSFCIAVCEDWADGKIFQEFKLVLLLPLREQEVSSAGSLLDLLKLLHPSQKVCDLVKDYFEEDEGSILIVADGWDELGKEKRDKGTFLYKLLFGSQYSSVSTIVTSRPSASASFHHGKFIDRFAEICGFDKEHIVEYISSEFADDQAVASDILEKLESNPLVASICSIPLNCAIICHLWQILKVDFPTTMTGLYTKVILHTILRSIRKPPDSIYKNIKSLPSFDDLPESLQQSWWLLCEFAFQTLKEDKLVFSDKELRDFFPQGLSLDNDILCFSLLQSSVSMLEVGCGTSFHFLHLTFQEYLAALFLVKQKSCQVAVADSGSLISGLTNLFEVPLKHNYCDEDSIVLRFFFGIAYTFEIFQSSIGQRILTSLTGLNDRCLPRDFVLCHWAFEAHNDQFVRIVIDKLNGSYYLPYSTHDFVAVAYVIAKTPEYTDEAISLCGYGLRNYHLTVLTDILSKKDGKLQVPVRRLDLSFNELTDRDMAGLFNRAASAFQSLSYLALDDLNLSNMIDDECIIQILAALAQSFNEVVFSFKNKNLDVPSLKVFRNALCHHQLNNLTELHLAGSLSSELRANEEFIQELGHCCGGLKVLNLSSNNLSTPGVRALGKILPQLSLERLELFDTKLGDEGMYGLNQGLESPCHIGCLHLGKNDIHAAGILYLTDSICAGKMVIKDSLYLTKNPLDLKGAEAVVRLLSDEHFLAEDVALSYCELTFAEGDSAHSISPHVGESSITCAGFREWVCGHKIKADGVKTLGLPYSNFSGEGIHVLAGFMHLCPHLRSLNCAVCNITSSDLKQLLSLLSQSNLQKIKNLEEWNLYYNYLDDDGVSALIEHLSMFPSLTDIGIDENSQVSSEMCRNLEEICEKVCTPVILLFPTTYFGIYSSTMVPTCILNTEYNIITNMVCCLPPPREVLYIMIHLCLIPRVKLIQMSAVSILYLIPRVKLIQISVVSVLHLTQWSHQQQVSASLCHLQLMTFECPDIVFVQPAIDPCPLNLSKVNQCSPVPFSIAPPPPPPQIVAPLPLYWVLPKKN